MPQTTSSAPSPELSVVMPCLNEADTLEVCIRKAQRAMQEHNIDGEVVVADNGSADGSVEIAERLGARRPRRREGLRQRAAGRDRGQPRAFCDHGGRG